MVTTKRAALAGLIVSIAACYRTDLLEDLDVVKQHVTIPLAGGLATGQDGKQLPIGKSEELQNVRPGRVGEAKDRVGTSVLSVSFIGSGGTLPQSWALGTLRGELVSFSGVGDHPANAYSPTATAWATDNPAASVFTAVRTKRRGPIAATRQQISGNGLFPDMVYAGGYYFAIYSTTRNGVNTIIETVIDATTGAAVVETADAAGPYSAWGVRVVNGFAVFVFATAAQFTIDTWTVASVTSGRTTRTTVAKTVANPGRAFDMLVKDATTVSAAYSDGTNVQAFDYVPTAGAATFWTPKDSAAANMPVDYSVAWVQDFGASGKIALAVLNAAGLTLKVHWDIPTVGATRQAVSSYTVFSGGVAGSLGAVAAFTMSNAATGQFTVLYDTGTPPTAAIRAGTREAGVITTGIYYRGLSIDSKPFVGSDGKYYILASYRSIPQSTRFIVRVPETITNFSSMTAVVSKTQLNSAYYTGTAQSGPVAPFVSPAAGEFVVATTVQLRLPGNPSTYIPQGVGIDLVHVKFKTLPDTTSGPPREAIDSLFTPAGIVGQFDGRSYVDAGFNLYPEQPVAAPGGGGFVHAAGTYYYVDVYSWVDFSGRTWRSTPSLVAAVATALNVGNIITSNTYRLVDRDDITIEHYRGALNDNVTFALIGTSVNDPAVDTVNFTDTFADTVVAGGQALYTNGAVGNKPLAADGIPGSSIVAITKDRAWLVSNDNPYEVWMSNKFIPGQGWRFSEQNKLVLNDNQGPVFGVAQQPSGVVVVIKANCYYLVSGDGPNQAGNGGSFSVSAPIVGDGTTNPRSILETPSGIEFRSDMTARAYYRISTANSTEYIGQPIERYTRSSIVGALPVVGAVLISLTGETRYYTPNSDNTQVKTLVHDPITDVWSVDVDNPGNVNSQFAACSYLGGAAVANSAGVFIDDASHPGADGAFQFTVYTVTPWIKGSDLDGYVTFFRVRGVGEAASTPPPISITLQADFDATTNVTVQAATPGTAWDWELKYPAKLSSFRFIISYVASAVPVKMAALVVEYGAKAGLVPMSYLKRSQ